MEQGVAPWRRPWRTELPVNLVSGKPYRGLNVFLPGSQGYGSRYWLTFNQAARLGAQTFSGGEDMLDDNRQYGSSCRGGGQKRCASACGSKAIACHGSSGVSTWGAAVSQYSRRQTKRVRCYRLVGGSGFWGNANSQKYKRTLDDRRRPNP
ncbi:MAG: DUF1738 domain-containing protein [Acidobacteria bacterium Pan2503]|uniref:DUF1738 domain-containing protein n=1 Tax=Candidatus Acidiferrum panamense TaxID=2741543 RepID=A0A7V8NRU0_9BACT|nr:DUF1738 domain-containing protein [Candidatus Acidoferrum panamensis]